jgi:hypothetical protein
MALNGTGGGVKAFAETIWARSSKNTLRRQLFVKLLAKSSTPLV